MKKHTGKTQTETTRIGKTHAQINTQKTTRTQKRYTQKTHREKYAWKNIHTGESTHRK